MKTNMKYSGNMSSACIVRMVLILFTIHFSLFTASAQPKARRVQPQAEQPLQKKKSAPKSAMTKRAEIAFPTAVDMPEDVVWRREIYREINLEDDANAGLYYPVEPQGKQLNLFTYIFKLAQNGYIPIYEYPTDGSDVFEETSKIEMKTMLDNYHIFYEEAANGKLKVDNSDIPSAEVKKLYLKESAYYDQANSSFHIKVLALCPVMMRSDDFIISDDPNSQGTAYPLFWVKYSDLEPYLNRQSVMISSLNNAATMSMDDFFTTNQYRGKIYKTTNRLGKTLAQICDGDTAKMSAEQKRIEAELEAFRKNIFGDPERKDSLDSIANANPQNVKAAQKAKAKAAKKSGRRSNVGNSKSNSSSSSPSNSAARVSVRRQRH